MLFSENSLTATTLLEPLCKATQTLFEPVRLFPNDYLVIDLDDSKEKDKFIVQCKAMRPYNGVLRNFEKETDIVEFAAQRYVVEGTGSRFGGELFFRKIPEKVEMGFGKYKCAVTDFTALVIASNWPEDRIFFVQEAAELKYQILIKRFFSQNRCAVMSAEYKTSGIIPKMPADYVEHSEWPLLPYQKVGLLCTLHQESSALFMEPGTGKTATTIARICLESVRKRAGRIPGVPKTIFRALIVCPNAVRMNWQNEFSKFAVVPGKVAVLRGDLDVRRRRLIDAIRNEDDCAWGAAIIGIDAVENTAEELKRVAWDLVIVDESHLIKNNRTARWQALMDVGHMHYVRQRQILTGTPIANTLMDLWAQLEFLGKGLSGFQAFSNYRKFHGVFQKTVDTATGSAVERMVAFKNIPLIQERLARVSFMVTKKEANLQLPDKVYDTIEVQMTKQQAEWYKKVKDQLALEIIDLMEDTSKRLTADHVLTKLLRLAQITCGHVKWDEQIDFEGTVLSEGHTEPIPGGNPKIDAVIDAIKDEFEQDPKGKKIIWCCFRQDIFSFQQRLAEEGIPCVSYFGDTTDKGRAAAEKAFNEDPNCRVFLANPATAGAGLNLIGYPPESPDSVDTYTDHEIFFSQSWRPVERGQAEDRAHRKGTRCILRITDVVVPGTVDEEIRARVIQKQKVALEIQDVRAILRSVLDLPIR